MFLENSAEPGKDGELNPVPVQAVKNVLQTYPDSTPNSAGTTMGACIKFYNLLC